MSGFEVRNRYGDVVQRGEVERVEEREMFVPFYGLAHITEFEFHDPPELRRSGDELTMTVEIHG